MPFNGAGQYAPPPAAPYPAVGGTTILASQFNTVINDIATALSNCITRDGQSPATANIPLGSFKLTGVGAPGATNDALTFGQAGTMTTLTLTTSVLTPIVDNPAGTLSLRAAGNQVADVVTSGNGGIFPHTNGVNQLGSPSFVWAAVFCPVFDSGTTGPLQLKTNNGSEQFRIGHAASSVDFIQALGSAAGNPGFSAQGTSTNINIFYDTKGTGAHTFRTDDAALDSTQFAILHTASATRNITVTGSNGGNPTLGVTGGNLSLAAAVLATSFEPQFTSAETALTNSANTSTALAHGLGTVPRFVRAVIRNKTTELGYSVGDEVAVGTSAQQVANSLNQIDADATNVYLRSGGVGLSNWQVLNKSTNISGTITLANWKLVFYVWK